jgi:zinc protease
MSESFITRTKLANGLTVHLKEIHTAPIISQWVWYRVGSRNEPAGLTGISHWVEHMQFKGTPNLPAGVLDKAISREGGNWNAMTFIDWTTYYETLPADRIELGLRLEADRMVNSSYPPEEVESERTVVISEREGDENEPMFRLGEAVQATAFKVHTYQHEVIGSKEDLHKISRDDLYHHYRSHYHPGNAILAMAGDFNTPDMLANIEQAYGVIPAGTVNTYIPPQEPATNAEERVEVKGPGKTTFLQLAYHAPPANQTDFFSFMVLDSILTGPSLSMMGGLSNKTSRLYRALVEREHSVSISGSLQTTIDPYLYDLTTIVHPKTTWESCLSALDGEIKRLQDTLVSPDEIKRAVKQARALFAYGSDNITNQALWLGMAEIFATYDWFLQYVTELEKVTPVDVQHIAQTYLVPDRRVVGVYLPDGSEEAE